MMTDNTKSNICCKAKNCVYHRADDTCRAKSIKICGADACNCSQTECATFEEKDN